MLYKTLKSSRIYFVLCALGFLVMSLPIMIFASNDGFTMSIIPSSDVVSPGETIQLTVRVHNNSWPESEKAEVAAFQATLDYDQSCLEYLSVEIPEGTMGDFNPDSRIVLGYGEGHPFQEYFDCAVLTMKVSENVSGDISITLNDAILAKQDATELSVSVSDPLILKAGEDTTGDNTSGSSGNSAAIPSNNSGAKTGNSGSGSTDSVQNRTAQNASSAQGNKKTDSSGSKKEQTDNDGSASSGDSKEKAQRNKTDNASTDLSSNQNDETNDSKSVESSTLTDGKIAEDQDKNENKMKLAGLIGLLASAAAIAAGILIYRKRS